MKNNVTILLHSSRKTFTRKKKWISIGSECEACTNNNNHRFYLCIKCALSVNALINVKIIGGSFIWRTFHAVNHDHTHFNLLFVVLCIRVITSFDLKLWWNSGFYFLQLLSLLFTINKWKFVQQHVCESDFDLDFTSSSGNWTRPIINWTK